MVQNKHSKFYLYIYPLVKDTLSETQITVLQSQSMKLKKNPMKIQTICTHPSFPAIQTGDIMHDYLKVKMCVIPEFELFHVENNIPEIKKQTAQALNRCFTNKGYLLLVTTERFTKEILDYFKINKNITTDQIKSEIFYEFYEEKDNWNFKIFETNK